MRDLVRRGTFLITAASHLQHLTVKERSSSSMVMSRYSAGTVKVEYQEAGDRKLFWSISKLENNSVNFISNCRSLNSHIIFKVVIISKELSFKKNQFDLSTKS